MSQFMFVVFVPCEDKKSESGTRSRTSSASGKASRPGSFSQSSGNDVLLDASGRPPNAERGGNFGGSVKSLPILGSEGPVPYNKSALSLSPEKPSKDELGNEQAPSRERKIGTKEDALDEEENGVWETPSVEWDFGEPSKTDETIKDGESEKTPSVEWDFGEPSKTDETIKDDESEKTPSVVWDFGEPSKIDEKTNKDGDANTEGESSKVGVIVSSDNIELQEIAEKTPRVESDANGQVKGKFTVQSLEGQTPVENNILPDQTPGQDAEDKLYRSESEETIYSDTPNKPVPSGADGRVKGKFTVQSLEGQNTVEDRVLAEVTPGQDGEDMSERNEGRKSEETNDLENPNKAGPSGRIRGEVSGERGSVDNTTSPGKSPDQESEETSDRNEGDKSANASNNGDPDKPGDRSAKSSLQSSDKLPMEEKEKAEEEGEGELVDFLGKDNMTLVQKLEVVLKDLSVTKVMWLTTKDDKYYQVTFETSGPDVEPTLSRLRFIGVGEGNTSISVYPATLHYEGSGSEESDSESDIDSEEEENKIAEVAAKLNWKTSEFKKSIKARLVVDQVVENIRLNAEFTFDYLMLIILASLIAGLGLAENSSVVLVASMLISPLMGPILASTFGTVIQNKNLRDIGIRSEIYGLLICLASGFLFGLISGAVNLHGAKWGGSDSWPTTEMAARGHYRSLWVGVLIALPSGAGVALSVLGGNAGSLVGVAISASLLPPAVNAGMLWAFSVLTAVSPLPQYASQITPFNTTNNETMTPASTLCPEFVNNEYTAGRYSCTMAIEALVMGFISLLLTLLNIICIFLMGVFVLKIKEVAPKTSHLGATKEFFHRDIKVARDAYSTLKGQSSKELGRKFLDEYKRMVNEDIITEDDINTLEVRDMIEEVEQSDDVQGLINRVPGKSKAKPISSQMKDIFQEAESSVQARENYDTIHPPVQPSVYHTLTPQYYNQYSPSSPLSPQMFTPFGAPAYMRRRSSGSNAQLTVRGESRPQLRPVSAAPGTPTIVEEGVEEDDEKQESGPKPHRSHRSRGKSAFFPTHYQPHSTFIPPPGFHGFVPVGTVHRTARQFEQQATSTVPTVTVEDGKGKGKEKKKASFDVTAVAETSTSKGVSAKKTRFNVQTVKHPDSSKKDRDSSKNAKDSSKKSKDSPKESLLDKSSSSKC